MQYWFAAVSVRCAGARNVGKVFTYTHKSELAHLYRMAKGIPENGTVLEIGSHLGASACFLAAGARRQNGTVYCVDLWQNVHMPDDIADTFPEFKANTAAFESTIVPIRKRSEELTDEDLPAEGFDLIFIDGDHRYEGCKADIEVLAHRLKPNGVIAFHDMATWEGVSRSVGELLATGDWTLGGLVKSLAWLRHAKWGRTVAGLRDGDESVAVTGHEADAKASELSIESN